MQSKQKSFDRDLQELRKEEEETKSAAAVEEKNQTEPNERGRLGQAQTTQVRDTLWIHTHARQDRTRLYSCWMHRGERKVEGMCRCPGSEMQAMKL